MAFTRIHIKIRGRRLLKDFSLLTSQSTPDLFLRMVSFRLAWLSSFLVLSFCSNSPPSSPMRGPSNTELALKHIDAEDTIQAHHLIEAIESQPVDNVVWLLKNGADANAKLGLSSVLTVAMKRYCIARDSIDISKIIMTFKMKESIQRLLEYGAMPGYEEIRMSILTRDKDIVRWCLGANKKFEIDLYMLCLAIENSDITGVTVLKTLLKDLKAQSLLGSMIEGVGQPLVFALLKAPRTSLTIRVLLKNGASPDSFSESDHSVLELACQMDSMHVVLLLLSAGSTLDPNGRRRLLLAHGRENLDLIDCLKAFLMLLQGSRCPLSIVTQLPIEILNEVWSHIILIGARAYSRHQ